MKNLLLSLALCLVASPVIAEVPQYQTTQTTETPTETPAIYTIPEKTLFTAGEVLTAKQLNQLVYRVEELERKVEGMQKQITILHGKKENKAYKPDWKVITTDRLAPHTVNVN
jgi:hypothetical protein